MALIKCSECGKEFSDKASACPNCSYPIKKEKAKEKRKKILSQSKHISYKILKVAVIVCIIVGVIFFIGFSIKLKHQNLEHQKELKHQQEIISKYTGGNAAIILNKVWKTEYKDYYETYEFKENYTCKYYKSGYSFEFNGEVLPSFEESETYYYKVEETSDNQTIITVFEIDFNTEHTSIIDTLEYFPPNATDTLYFNETLYGDNNKIFLPDNKPYYEDIKK